MVPRPNLGGETPSFLCLGPLSWGVLPLKEKALLFPQGALFKSQQVFEGLGA